MSNEIINSAEQTLNIEPHVTILDALRGITGVTAAIANAVFNPTGKRVWDLPITLDKLL